MKPSGLILLNRRKKKLMELRRKSNGLFGDGAKEGKEEEASGGAVEGEKDVPSPARAEEKESPLMKPLDLILQNRRKKKLMEMRRKSNGLFGDAAKEGKEVCQFSPHVFVPNSQP